VTERLFTPADQWWGGHYGVWIELRARSDDESRAALESLWSHPALEGPYLRNDAEPRKQSVADPRLLSKPQYGVGTLHDGARVPCCAQLLEGREDSLVFEVPMHGLDNAWPHAVADDPNDSAGAQLWQEPLAEWFAEIARCVFARVRFPVATVGEEADPLDDEELERWRAGDIPDERWLGVLLCVDDTLAWYPPTVWEPIDVRVSEPPA